MSTLEDIEPLLGEKCSELGVELFETRFFRVTARPNGFVLSVELLPGWLISDFSGNPIRQESRTDKEEIVVFRFSYLTFLSDPGL